MGASRGAADEPRRHRRCHPPHTAGGPGLRPEKRHVRTTLHTHAASGLAIPSVLWRARVTFERNRCVPRAPRASPPQNSFAQKGVSLRMPEAAALVEAVMDGKVHKDYVVIGGAQCARAGALSRAHRTAANPVLQKVPARPQCHASVCGRPHHHRHGVGLLWAIDVDVGRRWRRARQDTPRAGTRHVQRSRARRGGTLTRLSPSLCPLCCPPSAHLRSSQHPPLCLRIGRSKRAIMLHHGSHYSARRPAIRLLARRSRTSTSLPTSWSRSRRRSDSEDWSASSGSEYSCACANL